MQGPKQFRPPPPPSKKMVPTAHDACFVHISVGTRVDVVDMDRQPTIIPSTPMLVCMSNTTCSLVWQEGQAGIERSALVLVNASSAVWRAAAELDGLFEEVAYMHVRDCVHCLYRTS